jgi:uncharacterized OB-fold protein
MKQDKETPQAPLSHPENQPFWQAAEEGRFIVRKCAACGRVHWYPRAICPFCFSDKTEWMRASGRGTIYSYSVMRRADEPYAIAYVTLEEGPSMLTNIVDCDFDALKIGQRVQLVFAVSESRASVPMFTPIGTQT